tara:strand:+ start:165432 stop:166511 length:1080 start_codon:yes stop_codon:yes gene_type:complete
MKTARRSGFSLIELTITIAITATMTTILLPALTAMQSKMRGVSSESNLSTIGQIGAMYAQDNEDRIFTFTWKAGVPFIQLKNGNQIVPSSDQEAAAYQVQNILQRATGRIIGPGSILAPKSRLMYRRYSHLVLADYMGGNVSDPMWADPADANLLHWQLNPLEYQEDNNSFPYGNGLPQSAGYDSDANWTSRAIVELWAFASSYQTVPHAWQSDFGPQYAPNDITPHLFTATGGIPELGERRFHEVRFPSRKVHMFEEFDREQPGTPYFAYDHAAPAKLMFDGSINTLQSGLARSSVSPADYLNGNKIVWEQNYVPLDTFPIPLGGLGDTTQLNMRYRWTLGGLTGTDYYTPLSRPYGR